MNMFPMKRATFRTGVMSYIQNGVAEGSMHYDSRVPTPEIVVGSTLDSQNGNLGSNDTPKWPNNLGVNPTKAYNNVMKNLREDSDDIEDGSLPCTPELHSDSEVDVSSCPAGDEMLDQDTRQLISRFLKEYTGLSNPRWKEDKELSTIYSSRLVQDRPGLLQRLRVIRVGSKDIPLALKQQYSEMLSQDEEFLKDFCKELEQYREDPEPSCVSMKSDQSKDFPPSFNLQHSETEQDRADSPEPSCVSMKSDQSKDFPPSFNLQHSKEASDVSTDRRSPLDSVFMCLEENVVGFVKKELKKFKEMLSPDYPECPEDQCEDEGVVDEEEAQRRYGSKLVLNMTLVFMRRMNLGELADTLEKRSARLLQSVAENTSQNAGLMSAIRMVFSTCFG